jgi:hypothetical protein
LINYKPERKISPHQLIFKKIPEKLPDYIHPTEIYVMGEAIDNQLIEKIGQINSLKKVMLNGFYKIGTTHAKNTKLNAHGIIPLRSLPKLTDLSITSFSNLEEELYVYLSDFLHITKFYLHDINQVNSKALDHLSGKTYSHVANNFKGLTNLCNLRLNWCKNVDDNCIKRLSGFEQLTHLDLSYGYFTGVIDAPIILPNLTEFLINNSEQLKTIAFINTPNLTKLDASSCPNLEVNTTIPWLSNLIKLNLRGSKKVTSKHIQNIVTSKVLMSLDASDTLLSDEEEGLSFLSELPEVETLIFESCPGINGVGSRYFSNLSKLKVLSFKDCTTLTSDISECFSGLTSLVNLNFEGCVSVSNKSLEHLAKTTSIKILNIKGCKLISNMGIYSLAALTNLQTLLLTIKDEKNKNKSLVDKETVDFIKKIIGEKLKNSF